MGIAGWDLGDNPAGRALTLADLYQRALGDTGQVEIIGALLPGRRKTLWPPMQGSGVHCHPLRIENASAFLVKALHWVAAHPFDMVHLSKPRFPNLVFGLLYELVWGARVVWDVDDEERGFLGCREPLDLATAMAENNGRLPDLHPLHGAFWTRLTLGSLQRFPVASVSNPALQSQYGGRVVPHVRDEQQFVPSTARRLRARQRFGIPEQDRVVLFFGTARKHKGLWETAQLLATLGDPRVHFVVVGDFPQKELRLRDALVAMEGVEVTLIGGQPYREIPDVVALGDFTVLLQDTHGLAASYQLPAKLVDALAMGLVVLAQVTPALQWIADAGAIIPVTPATLADRLREQIHPGVMQVQGEKGRSFFLEHLSMAAHVTGIQNLVACALARPAPIHNWAGQLAPLLEGRPEALLHI